MEIPEPRYCVGTEVSAGWSPDNLRDAGEITDLRYHNGWEYWITFENIHHAGDYGWYKETEISGSPRFVSRW